MDCEHLVTEKEGTLVVCVLCGAWACDAGRTDWQLPRNAARLAELARTAKAWRIGDGSEYHEDACGCDNCCRIRRELCVAIDALDDDCPPFEGDPAECAFNKPDEDGPAECYEGAYHQTARELGELKARVDELRKIVSYNAHGQAKWCDRIEELEFKGGSMRQDINNVTARHNTQIVELQRRAEAGRVERKEHRERIEELEAEVWILKGAVILEPDTTPEVEALVQAAGIWRAGLCEDEVRRLSREGKGSSIVPPGFNELVRTVDALIAKRAEKGT